MLGGLVGIGEGLLEGAWLGAKVGKRVGLAVGSAEVGDCDGSKEGSALEGLRVGC